MKGVFLGACMEYHKNYNLDYNDIEKTSEHINIIGDMLKVNLNNYDFILASPPCNYYSRANYRREISNYAQTTKHLLPELLKKCNETDKPFLIENVRNYKLYEKTGIIKYCIENNIFIYIVGRHTYFTKELINLQSPQNKDNIQKKQHKSKNLNNYRQGGENVHNTFEIFLKLMKEYEERGIFKNE